MNRFQRDRRRFLRTVGASALTYPFLRGVPSYAATASPPTYMVLLFTPCGVVRHLWGAEGAAPSGATTATTSPLKLRATLAPLASVQDKVIVLDGLNAKAANGSHEAGMAALWTGVTCSGSPATAPSIDQVVAGQLNSGRPYKSLELMVRSSQDFTDREVKTRMIYTGPGAYADPYDDPVAARAALFPSTPTSTTVGGSTPADKKTVIRGKVFTQLNTELTALQSRLCTEDRYQLQALQQAWNDLDSQLSSAAMAAASCSPPAAAPAGYASPSLDFPTSAKLQMDILAMALACDLTRVASLQMSTATSQVTHTWIDASQKDTHHNYSHIGPTSLYFLGADLYNPQSSVISSYAPQLAGIDLWYAQQVAYLANKLGQFSTGGKTLLDQSVICWGNELDLGAAHNHDDTPFVLIGGGNGKLKTNQVVRFPLQLPGDPTTNAIVDRCHNDLLLTVANVMGVGLTSFGDAQYNKGPITEILA